MHTTSQSRNIRKHAEKLDLRLSRPATIARENWTKIQENKNVSSPMSNSTKNEAEIISDLPMNQLGAAFPAVYGMEQHATAGMGCSVANARGQGQRRGSTSESLDSDLRSMRRNSLEGRRFRKSINDLDKQSTAGDHELRQKIKEVFKDYNRLVQRSPTADEWLLLKKSRKSMLQERERQTIARRYSRRERHFRAPPELLEEVSKIRSHAMMEAGLQLDDAGNDDSVDNDLVLPMESIDLSRRHTISMDHFEATLPQINKMNAQRIGTPYGRRMTLADTRILQGVHDLQTERLLKLYMDSCLNDNLEVDDLGQNPKMNSTNSETNEEVTITEIK